MPHVVCSIETCFYKHVRKPKCTAFNIEIRADFDKPICSTFKHHEMAKNKTNFSGGCGGERKRNYETKKDRR